MLYETIRIVNKLKPKYVIWENVKNLISKKHRHNFDNYINRLNKMGYNSYYKVLNSKDYGIPQNRERVFTISIRKDIDNGYVFPEKKELKLRLKDMLENNVDEKYYLNDAQINRITTTTCQGGNTEPKVATIKIKNNTKKGYLEATDGDGIYTNTTTKRGTVQKGICQTLTSIQDKGVVEKVNVIGNYMPSGYDSSRIVDSKGIAPTVKENHGTVTATNCNLRIRKLTPLECWRLQGFDDEDFYKAKQRLNNTFYKGRDKSNSQLYKQAGNSITVNVLEKILERLLK